MCFRLSTCVLVHVYWCRHLGVQHVVHMTMQHIHVQCSSHCHAQGFLRWELFTGNQTYH